MTAKSVGPAWCVSKVKRLQFKEGIAMGFSKMIETHVPQNFGQAGLGGRPSQNKRRFRNEYIKVPQSASVKY